MVVAHWHLAVHRCVESSKPFVYASFSNNLSLLNHSAMVKKSKMEVRWLTETQRNAKNVEETTDNENSWNNFIMGIVRSRINSHFEPFFFFFIYFNHFHWHCLEASQIFKGSNEKSWISRKKSERKRWNVETWWMDWRRGKERFSSTKGWLFYSL